MVEVAKMKKEFDLDTPEKFTYSKWRKWEKWVEKYISANFNLIGVPLSYVISRYEVPETVYFTDAIYESGPEHFCIIAAPLTGAIW